MSDSGSTQQRLNNGGDHNHLTDDSGGGGGGGGAKSPANNDVMSVSMSAAVDLENDPSGNGGRKRSAGAGGVSYSKRSKLRSFSRGALGLSRCCAGQ